jgi:hypothetical protein
MLFLNEASSSLTHNKKTTIKSSTLAISTLLNNKVLENFDLQLLEDQKSSKRMELLGRF